MLLLQLSPASPWRCCLLLYRCSFSVVLPWYAAPTASTSKSLTLLSSLVPLLLQCSTSLICCSYSFPQQVPDIAVLHWIITRVHSQHSLYAVTTITVPGQWSFTASTTAMNSHTCRSSALRRSLLPARSLSPHLCARSLFPHLSALYIQIPAYITKLTCLFFAAGTGLGLNLPSLVIWHLLVIPVPHTSYIISLSTISCNYI